MNEDQRTQMILMILLRVFGTVVCVIKAKKINRSEAGWGLFGFVFPIVAMIWIQFMKPIMVWNSNINLDKEENY